MNVVSQREISPRYGLTIGNLNVRSLAPSSALVSDYVRRHHIDVMCFTETWLRNGEPDVPVDNLLVASRLDRKRKKGGGVAIYCRSDLTFSKLAGPSIPTSSRLELIWISVKCGHNRSLVIGCVYRPPMYEGIRPDLEALELSIQKFLSEGKQVILCGDLNCDLLRPNLPHVRPLLSLIDNVGMYQCVSKPTRISSTSATLIDIVLVSDHSLVTDCASEDCIVSDHNLIVVNMKVRRHRVIPKTMTYRRWSTIDSAVLGRELRAISWSSVLLSPDPDDAWQCWTDIMQPILDRHAPLVTVTIKHKSGFGVTAETRHLIRSTAAQLRTYRHSGCQSDLVLYKSMRRQVRGAIASERRLKFQAAIQMNRSSRDTWNLISSTLGKSKFTRSLDRNTARSFNEFFCSVGTSAQAIASAAPCHSDAISGPPRVISTMFELRPVTFPELRSVVQSLRTYTAPGPDRLPASLFKSFLSRLAAPLLHIFNSSISSGVVPSSWKTAEVVPIYKGRGDPKCASNYRPISLLCVASKILEKLVSIQLMPYLEDCCIMSDEQFGFRPHHSVDHALITLTESIRSSIDAGDICLLVSLDLSKAFDSVNHAILLEKLSQYGIDDPWFGDYLSGRSQYVRGCNDAKGDVLTGVPQGSVLGPILFNLFVNDLPTVANEMCSIVQYADDTQVMVSGPPHDISGIITRLQVVLHRLAEWFSRNGLTLNVRKSQVSVFGSKAMLRRVDVKSINIFQAAVPVKSSILSLGVTLDSCLTWSKHVDAVVGKCVGMLIRLRHLRHIMSCKTIAMLVNALVLPHIRFCIAVWGNCNATQGKRINKIIKFARRIAGPEAKRLAWHGDVASEHNIAALKIVRQCLLSPENMPPSISSLFKVRQSERTTRQCDSLHLDIPRTELKRASLSYNGSKLWNSLPSKIRNSSKTEFTKYILEKADIGELHN